VLGYVRFDSVQPRYNLLFREFEREMFPLCSEEGIGVIPYNPLAGGLLSGKYDRSQPPVEGSRFTLGAAGAMYQDRYWHENVFDTVEQLAKTAESAGIPMPTLAVAWVLAHPAVTAPIIGASRPEQLDATLQAAETHLDDDLVERLNALTAPYRRGEVPRGKRLTVAAGPRRLLVDERNLISGARGLLRKTAAAPQPRLRRSEATSSATSDRLR
jgi:1-deoxyxylulose-5-phosphate synthase